MSTIKIEIEIPSQFAVGITALATAARSGEPMTEGMAAISKDLRHALLIAVISGQMEKDASCG